MAKLQVLKGLVSQNCRTGTSETTPDNLVLFSSVQSFHFKCPVWPQRIVQVNLNFTGIHLHVCILMHHQNRSTS